MIPDPQQTRINRGVAIQASDDHAERAWRTAAMDAIEACARRFVEFTADEVWLTIPAGFSTHEPSALGPRFIEAKKAGLIENSHRKRPTSFLPQRHRQDITIWASKAGGLEVPTPDSFKAPVERPTHVWPPVYHEPKPREDEPASLF